MEGNGEVGEALGNGEEKKSDKPFVFDVVAEAEAAVEFGKGSECRIESEGLVLENVRGGERG